jgi:hypothetical protein
MARRCRFALDPFAVALGGLDSASDGAAGDRLAQYDRLSPKLRRAIDQAPIGVWIDDIDRCEQTLGTAAALAIVADTVREGLGDE